ncbi:M16 family metallopeptidase [Streptomyces sp. ME19-01-6]|uniref:M16 family metallopeptidase n=1 Tax=Streptomyces sp. ME19-01-6 TaxID=3028686 RepID=UPI0029A6AD16|nr:insulinase family protein [Streptomyces sp. ME19-01-6]MDX3230405.1 insulinase family protein [Streptomyces sp. ME19-01-6]
MLENCPALSVGDSGLKTAGICLAVDHGPRHDPEGSGRLAHALEHLLMAYPLVGADSLCEHIERLGGRTNAETGLEHMLFHAQVLAEDLEEVLDLLLRAVTEPRHAPRIFASERSVVLQELAAAADPADVVQDAFLAVLFANHPLGRPVGGTTDEVEALDLPAVSEGHLKRFLPRRSVPAVVAPCTPANLPHGAATAPRRSGGRRGDTVPLKDLSRTPHRWADEFTWVSVGGSPSSLLHRTLRGERGLAYSFQAWDRGYAEAGAWRVLVGADTGHGDAIFGVVTTTLSDLAESGPVRGRSGRGPAPGMQPDRVRHRQPTGPRPELACRAGVLRKHADLAYVADGRLEPVRREPQYLVTYCDPALAADGSWWSALPHIASAGHPAARTVGARVPAGVELPPPWHRHTPYVRYVRGTGAAACGRGVLHGRRDPGGRRTRHRCRPLARAGPGGCGHGPGGYGHQRVPSRRRRPTARHTWPPRLRGPDEGLAVGHATLLCQERDEVTGRDFVELFDVLVEAGDAVRGEAVGMPAAASAQHAHDVGPPLIGHVVHTAGSTPTDREEHVVASPTARGWGVDHVFWCRSLAGQSAGGPGKGEQEGVPR